MIELHNAALDKLRSGALSIGIGLRQARTVDIGKAMKTAGFDWLFIDMEHNAMDVDTAVQISVAAQDAGIAPIVRVPGYEHYHATRVMDGGAQGIVVPHVDDAETAARIASNCRYPPVGMRSSGPIRAAQYGGADYQANANDEIIIMAMIETKEGLANLDAICATPGLDAVYIGPADLSFALGLEPRGDNPDPLHLATCDKILETAHKHGIKAVMHCAGAPFAAGAVKRGFDMVMLTSDLACMIAGARRQLDELKAETT